MLARCVATCLTTADNSAMAVGQLAEQIEIFVIDEHRTRTDTIDADRVFLGEFGSVFPFSNHRFSQFGAFGLELSWIGPMWGQPRLQAIESCIIATHRRGSRCDLSHSKSPSSSGPRVSNLPLTISYDGLPLTISYNGLPLTISYNGLIEGLGTYGHRFNAVFCMDPIVANLAHLAGSLGIL